MTTDNQKLQPISFNFTKKSINDLTIQTVNARDLHANLESRQQFSSWIKLKLYKGRFVENKDYVARNTNLFSGDNQILTPFSPGSNKVDYFLTVDAAKFICMIENTIKGDQIREYFLSCERRLFEKHSSKIDILTLEPDQLIDMLYEQKQKRIALEKKLIDADVKNAEASKLINNMKPHVVALQAIADTDDTICITDVAKAIGIRVKDLTLYLESNEWAYRRSGGNKDLISTAKKLEQGLTEHKIVTIGDNRIRSQMRITAKGLTKLALFFNGGASDGK